MVLRIILLGSTFAAVLSYKLNNLQLGGGKEFQSSQVSTHGEKGDKGYIGHHQVEKGAQGHHDKENHKKEYAEEGGTKKGYNNKDGYYSQQHGGEKGQKGYHFEDEGRYAKGHSTQGHHNIHKLDEYKKDTEFFNEDNDEVFEERHAGYEASKELSLGKQNAGNYNKKVFLDGRYGKAGVLVKGSHYFDDNGHNKVHGSDGYYGNLAEYGKKLGQNEFKNYGYTRFTHH
ncbi:hypothetical protein BDFB_011171 [Asbolus verrucosus]|uniref:Uncharacterized protein n=1 Tax=Asbolus verrucosus TaxID=1661398 RepID=A0A482VAP7_ASBVE|nr:hypothetical protein BDFB_011171 [Asbolus verrucosus]